VSPYTIPAGLRHLGAAADRQRPIRFRQAEFVQERLAQLVIEVLSGVDDVLFMAAPAHTARYRGGLDELRTVADDGCDEH